MKSQRKRWILLSAIILLLFCLAGCGAEISTRLNLDNAFTGERIITCVVAKSDANDSFKGGIDKIDEIIYTYCPEVLTFSREEGDGAVAYTFTLPFSSFDDYKAKVDVLLGRPSEIEFFQPDSVFSSGVSLAEDFTSCDLLGWFKSIVIEQQLMSDPSNLWELSDTTVSYMGEEISTSGSISFDLTQSNPISEIHIETVVSEQTAERNIRFDMPLETRDHNSEAVDAYMASLIPDGAEGTWQDTENGYSFVINWSAPTMADFIPGMTRIFGDSYSMVTDAFDNYPFVTLYDYGEHIDLYEFGDGADGGVYLFYNLSFENMKNRYLVPQNGDDEVDGGLYKYFIYDNSADVLVRMVEESRADHLLFRAILNKNGKIGAEIDIQFPAEEKWMSEKAAQYYSQQWDDVSAEVLSEEGEICRIILNPDQCAVDSRLAEILDVDSVLYHASVDKGLLKNRYYITLELYLSNLAEQAGIITGTGDFCLMSAYKLKQIIDSETELLDAVGETQICMDEVGAVNLYATAEKINILGVLLIILLIALIVAALIFGYLHAVKKLAEEENRKGVPISTLAREYRSKVFGVIGTTVSSGFRRLTDRYYPEGANKQLINYFYGSRLPILLLIFSVIVLPVIWALLILILSIFNSSIADTLAVFQMSILRPLEFIFAIAAIIWHLVERYKTNPAAEEEYDQVFAANVDQLKNTRGFEQLGLVSEQVSLAEPIKLVGPDHDMKDTKCGFFVSIWRMLRRAFIYDDHLIIKQGADGKIRYSCASQNILYFSENQLYEYDVNYDLCTGKLRRESTAEVFYQDLASVSKEKSNIKVHGLFKTVTQVFERFMVVTASGQQLSAAVDSGFVSSEELNSSIQAMQNLTRDRKAVCEQKRHQRRNRK